MARKKKEPVIRKYKCPICKQTDFKTNLIQNDFYPKRWIHESCFEEVREQKEADAKEQAEKNSMYEKLAEIYCLRNYEDLNKRTFTMFANLRAGNPVFRGKSFDKRYRAGFSYPIIERTLDEVRENIEYANQTKEFDSINTAIYYGIKIVVDRIPAVQRKYEREQRIIAFNEENRRKELEKVVDEDMLDAYEEDSITKFKKLNSKKKTDENDISAFLSGEE